MDREVMTDNRVYISIYRTRRLVQFFRAVSLFSMPIRSSELGLRRRR